MAQVFDRSSNALARMSLVLTGLIVIAVGVALNSLQRSPWVTRQGQRPDQPVPFSHKHHVQGLGLQCQYCHTSVEKSSYAGIPPTKTCMNCHSQIWTDAELLKPVRDSWATGASIQWIKVHDLPDYVYFNHEIHVNKGIGCASCHGRVDEMPLMYEENSLQMEWCLDCHRNPAKNLRPTSEIYNMAWEEPSSGKPVQCVPTGKGADGAGFDPKTRNVLIPNGEGKLSVIHQDTANKYHLVENVPTQFGVRTMDFDPSTHRLFSATADLTPDPGKRPPYKIGPGSFRLVVFGK